MKKISIVIPAYNEEKYIDRCLSSILAAPADNLLEIIVVDNNSTDRTAEIAKSFSQVRVVTEKKKGVNFARQKGLNLARGELVAFIDADTTISKNWFNVVDHYFKYHNVACLSGPNYFLDLSKKHKFAVNIFWHLAMPTYKLIGFMAIANNFIAPKSYLKKIGGFDTSIVFYGDDTDIARRLNKLGRVIFTKKLIIYASSRRLKQQGLFKTGALYSLNYFSTALFHRSLTKEYTNYR